MIGLKNIDCRRPVFMSRRAWALGAIDRTVLGKLPYRYYETLRGFYDARSDRFLALPLLGFEADTWFRASFLRVFNRINLVSAKWRRRPIRLSIHPHDLTLKLQGNLASLIARLGGRFSSLMQLLDKSEINQPDGALAGSRSTTASLPVVDR